MFKKPHKEKENILELTCSTCGKPVAGKARSDVTRYLFKESRCQCGQPKLVVADSCPEESTPPKALPHLEPEPEVEAIEKREEQKSDKPKPQPEWQKSVLANLPEQYEVLSMIGEGGMGCVYKVLDKNLNKIFAVKVLRPWLVENDDALRRFEQEAEAAKNLTHVNLASVYNFGVGKQGAPFLVMDYLEGDNLATVIEKEGCIDVPRALDLFIQIAETVGHAHLKGVIHRDIKPTNIIIERNSEGVEMAKLVDFGIAKVLPTEPGVTRGHTRTGEVFGSPPYMSPEQCLGNKLDAGSDIYAFGCVMYETLAGKPPFSDENSIKTILKHLDSEVPPFSRSTKQQAIPADLEYIVMRCLEKSPIDRYQSMHDLLDDLQKIKEGKPLERVRKPVMFKPGQIDYKPPSSLNFGARLTTAFFYVIFGACVVNLGFGYIAESSFYRELWSRYSPRSTLIAGATPTKMVSGDDYDLLKEKTDSFIEKIEDLAQSYIAAKQYDKALSLLEMASQHYRDSKIETTKLADVLQEIGHCYKMQGNYAKALPNYMNALRIYEEGYSAKYISQSKEPAAVLARECVKQVQEIRSKLTPGASQPK